MFFGCFGVHGRLRHQKRYPEVGISAHKVTRTLITLNLWMNVAATFIGIEWKLCITLSLKSPTVFCSVHLYICFLCFRVQNHTMCTYMWLLANSYRPVHVASLNYNWDAVDSNAMSLVVLNSVLRGKWNTPTGHNGVSGNIWAVSPPCDEPHWSTKQAKGCAGVQKAFRVVLVLWGKVFHFW